MNPIGRVLAFLGQHAIWMLFVGVFVGLVLPDLAETLRPLLAPAVVALLAASLLRVEWRAIFDYARRPVLAVALTAWLLLVSPLLTWLVLHVLPTPESLTTAIVLMAAAPPILAASAIAVLVGLDGALAVVTSLVSTLLTPLTLPLLALALLGLELDIEVGAFMLRLAAVILGAFALAAVIRRLFGQAWLNAHSRHIDGAFVVIMVIFAVAIMDGVTATLFARPQTVALWLAAAFLVNPLLQALGTLAFAWLGRRRALTVGLMTGNCNMGLLLAALPPETGFDVVLFFALAQLPMYMLPRVLLPVYRSALERPAPDAGGPDG